jgi:hypothetical protein
MVGRGAFSGIEAFLKLNRSACFSLRASTLSRDDLELSIDPRGESEMDLARNGTENRDPKLRFLDAASAMLQLSQWKLVFEDFPYEESYHSL